jgi:hypothetical protein
MAARTRKTTLSDSWKDKIKVSMLMNRLVDHGDGKIDLTNTQVRAIEIVLSKLVPTLASTTSDVRITTFTEYLDRIAALDTHAPEPPNQGETIQ